MRKKKHIETRTMKIFRIDSKTWIEAPVEVPDYTARKRFEDRIERNKRMFEHPRLYEQ